MKMDAEMFVTKFVTAQNKFSMKKDLNVPLTVEVSGNEDQSINQSINHFIQIPRLLTGLLSSTLAHILN